MSFFAEIVASLLVKSAEFAYEKVIASGFPLPAHLYVRSLARELREMPFIYKDLPLEVVADFVDSDLLTTTAENFYQTRIPSAPDRDALQHLVDYRQVLLIGEAGMGKTTLFRMAVQSVASGSRRGWPLKMERDLVPFFVPLLTIAPLHRFCDSYSRIRVTWEAKVESGDCTE
jgi:hypothetical protein